MHFLTSNIKKPFSMSTGKTKHAVWVLAIFFQLLFLFAKGQSGNINYYNEANKLFNDKKYYEASQVFEKYLESEKKGRSRGTAFAVEKKVKGKTNINPHQESVYRLSECYRFVHDYTRAEKWYQEATLFSTVAYPASQYWYGVMLRANHKYKEAFEAFTKFEETHKELDSTLINADKELANLKFIKDQMSKARQDQFILAPVKDRKHSSVYAMSLMQDDSIAFTATHSSPPEIKDGPETFYNDLYASSPGDEMFAHAKIMKVGGLEGEHNGLSTFTPDGKKMYFTRWLKNNGKTESAIYRSERKDSGWSQGERLDFPINIEGFSSTQPFMTKDGKFLLFASNRPGGQGNYDLWFASLDSNFQIISVNNMGNKVNSPGDDEAPYYHAQSRTLVFSTNGRIGMGGFDIFYSVGDFSLAHWDAPVNPGAPINSTRDDIYFISTDEENLWNTGWLSSDRSNDCCLALFSLKENSEKHITGTVMDSKTNKPLANVELVISNSKHPEQPLLKIKTDSSGSYHFELKNISRFRILARKNGYQPEQGLYGIHFGPGVDTVRNEYLAMNPLSKDSVDIMMKNILGDLSRQTNQGSFVYKKATFIGGTNTNLDSLANLMKQHPNIIVQIGGFTDGIASEAYNLKLAQRRVNTCIRYLEKKGIDPARLKGKAFGKCCPIAPETIDGKDNPAGRAKNRRVEFSLLRGDN
jgi:outer membrane protein OmpA-like peptidoglycan-associated protein/tetratricopeptide (TPR) repeat protein